MKDPVVRFKVHCEVNIKINESNNWLIKLVTVELKFCRVGFLLNRMLLNIYDIQTLKVAFHCFKVWKFFTKAVKPLKILWKFTKHSSRLVWENRQAQV